MYDYLSRHGYVNEHNAKMIQLGLNRVKSFLFDLTYTVIIGGLLQIPFEALCMEVLFGYLDHGRTDPCAFSLDESAYNRMCFAYILACANGYFTGRKQEPQTQYKREENLWSARKSDCHSRKPCGSHSYAFTSV